MRFNGPSPLRTFNLPVGDQPIGLGPGFSFGMGQPGLAGLGLGGLGVFGSIQSYMGQQGGSVGQGFVIPKGEVEEESVAESGLNVSNGMAAYSQMVGGLPLGPQM
ncbi:uncharacterized protein A4U43_C05F21180 [Asparagus officinalis]|uniref:Uncharacterized protein n=2 Tax=Asparagus officinalis TaxID=4686 RepID=A0A5P1ETA6_ASPOF|nr:uncharacterized protein A4U43_C05F21180 [Asparagus officinalis]